MRRLEEHRVLSLVSSAVFLLTVVVWVLTATNHATSPLFAFLARHGAPLLFVPVLLPCFSLVRLTRRLLLTRKPAPFLDGWLIHLAILLPYAILLRAAINSM